MTKPQVGMIGLAVMGSNLARNIERNGFPVVVYNHEEGVADKFVSRFSSQRFVASHSLADFVSKLATPRQIFMMIKAGSPVDSVTETLLPLLAPGDIIIDGGNSFFKDTQRREKRCRERGVNFLGVGVSGGEEGALNGASIMPGGDYEAWKIVAPIFERISAKAPDPCTAYVGPDGAGHFVKTVHNGIEYGDMQLIAEAYHVLRSIAGATPEELSRIFHEWNKGVLSSFLVEITAAIFSKRDPEGGGYLVDAILDKAGQKGTGMWTAQAALDLGVAVPTLVSAVEARNLSARKEERQAIAREFSVPPRSELKGERTRFIGAVHDALYCSKILSYAQGMALLAAASHEWRWNLKLHELASLWKGGCIIRARFLDDIRRAFERDPALSNLMRDPFMKGEIERTLPGLREVVGLCASQGIPALAFSASLAYFDSCRSAELPQNLTQAQRDYFGSHTYERKDRPGSFHTEWAG